MRGVVKALPLKPPVDTTTDNWELVNFIRSQITAVASYALAQSLLVITSPEGQEVRDSPFLSCAVNLPHRPACDHRHGGPSLHGI